MDWKIELIFVPVTDVDRSKQFYEKIGFTADWDQTPTEGLRWFLDDDSRIIVRPSGTEPKLKVYLEVIEPVTGDDLRGARERAASRLAALRAAYEGFTSI